MDLTVLEWALPVVTGIALAAAAGFRAFVPLLMVGLAGYFGMVELTAGFAWLQHPLTLVALAVATVLEVAAYAVPGLDHALDVLAAPVAIAAGIVVAASVMADLPTWLRWLAAIVAGGSATAAAWSLTSLGRAKTGALSGGLANPLFSAGELLVAALLAGVALLLPLLALLGIVVIMVLALRRRGH